MMRTRLGRVLAALVAVGLPALVSAPSGAGVNPGEDVFNFGEAGFFGSTGKLALNGPVVGMAATPTGKGYWMLARDGGVFGFGDAVFHGSTGNLRLNQPVVGLAAHPRGTGYWFVASDGGVFAFDVPFLGSMGAVPLNQPVVGMAASSSGDGYWLVARDGGIFAFGDARFAGSTGDIRLNQPIVGMAADPDGSGYWFVAADGGVFAFDAGFFGSASGRIGGDRVTGMAAHPGGKGYWLVTAKGAVLPFGEVESFGDASTAFRSVLAIASHPGGKGYWLAAHRALAAPPSVVLTAPQDTIRPARGSSCWRSDPAAPALCADVFGFPSDASILNVRRGDTVTVRFEVPDTPLGARVFLVDAPATDGGSVRELVASNPTTFVADFPVGLHRIGLSTGWVQGDASYSFRLNVR